MIGLFAIGLITLWVWLTWLLSKGGRRFIRSELANRTVRIVLVVAATFVWFGASFWYGGGRKIYYDAQVMKMCEVDGGVKVYETVELPADDFDKWGMVIFYRPNESENALGPMYRFSADTHYFARNSLDMWRSKYSVIRRKDDKLLGETAIYGRAGGDIPGPWHPSGYRCPDVKLAGPNALLKAVFIIREE